MSFLGVLVGILFTLSVLNLGGKWRSVFDRYGLATAWRQHDAHELECAAQQLRELRFGYPSRRSERAAGSRGRAAGRDAVRS